MLRPDAMGPSGLMETRWTHRLTFYWTLAAHAHVLLPH
ncbi:hypothetical protein Cadr_000014270 [Camelus dromedarius]|uniref:Uncharacterized protein n=1 Tax=Camelus dromedarius TaxID=9838 RepID=A0A5N4DP26_CAMDR|nr:hypothetical protein Cadr_000014270 [Camelus dromedarius]